MKLRATVFISLTFATALLADPASSTIWKPGAAPLMTRWAKDVSPTNALHEYPRPQMVRTAWQNLNGLWDYAIRRGDTMDGPSLEKFDGKILVPFPIESALSGVMKPFSPTDSLIYRRTFRVPSEWQGKRILLHFDAVDFETTVWLNGREIGHHLGGYDRFSFDITEALNARTDQELRVLAKDPTNEGDQARGKQTLRPGGAAYTATSGIWQTVWLEPVPAEHIERLLIRTNLSHIDVTVEGSDPGTKTPVRVVIKDGQKQVAAGEGLAGEAISIPIENAKLWAPGHPFLYDLEVTLSDDAVKSYAGMRTVGVAPDKKGVPRLLLNGSPLFQCGPLDQGFWPDGIHTAPTDEALRFDVEYVRDVGFNVIRKHLKVEPERWYYWADRLGVLVWQDIPSGNLRTDESRVQWEKELRVHVRDLANHPSIVLWVVFNEGWGQHDTARLARLLRELDPTRLIDNASGWYDERWGDVVDKHFYPGPGVPRGEEHRASVTGEFGGLGFFVPEHVWRTDAWSYQLAPTSEALSEQYQRLWQRAYDLSEREGLSAAIYTQITDVEQEANGLLSYDREVEKIDRATLRAANSGLLPRPTYRDIAADSRESGQKWLATTTEPPKDWAQPAFDASSWKTVEGGFGSKYGMEAFVRTQWTGESLWLRREFTVPPGGLNWPLIQIHYGEDAEIFINGVPACQPEGFVNCFGRYEIAPAARATIKPGKNLLAVRLVQRNKGGEEYVDIGLVDEILPPRKP